MVPHQIMELTLSGCPVHVLQDIGSSVSDLRNLPLESTVRRIQEMLPRGWKEVGREEHKFCTFTFFISSNKAVFTLQASGLLKP